MKRLYIFAVMGASLPTYNVAMQTFSIAHGKTLTIQKGDITKCHVDAIVNAANEQLAGGAGVCGAIFDAAERDALQTACNEYPLHNNVRCPVGQARITTSGNLITQGVRHIIHAVGPDCRIIKNEQQQNELLAQAYHNALRIAHERNLASLALPFISSAIYAFPKDRAAAIAIATVIERMRSDAAPASVFFVLFSQEDFELFARKMHETV